MAKKITPDYIQFTLSLDASQAQTEINKLNKNSAELRNENKALRESMNNLIATGKAGSEEYTNLEKAFRANSKAISENEAKVKQLFSSMDKGSKTYAQLNKEAKALQRQLDNTSKALNPEKYDQLQKELDETKEAMRRLRNEVGDEKGGGMAGQLGKVGTIIQGIWLQVGSYITQFAGQAVEKIKEFVSESLELATQADGVQHAFDELNRPDLLANLREATKGTVGDLQLMTAVMKARDFRIPVDDLGKYLAFAQLKAQQTGQSVEYMTDSIVTGLGRQSLLILDNLGLSAAEINEEVAKTGDFMQAVSAIVERQLAQSEQYVSAADEVAQADTRLENAKLRLGQRLSWLGDLWTDLKNVMADVVNAAVSTATDKFYEQREEVVRLYETYQPLISRYDELKAKTELSTDEQTELNNIITRLSENLPGVTTRVDEYGNALDISSEKANNFLERQKALLQYMNREAIEQTESDLEGYRWKYENALRAQESGGVYRTSAPSVTGYTYSYFDNTPETLRQIDEDVRKYGQLIQGAEQQLEKLRGDSLEKALQANVAREKQRQEFIAMNKKQLEEWLTDEKNAQSEYRDLATSILNGKTTTTTGGGNADAAAKAAEAQRKAEEKAAADAAKAAEKQAAEEEKQQQAAEARRKKEDEDMNAYLIRYGSFYEKQQAIRDKYTALMNDPNTTEYGKKTLQKQMEEELAALDMEKLKKQINWELIFSDLDSLTKETLQKVKKQLTDFVQSTEYQNMTVDQKQVVTDALDKIQTELIDHGGLLGDLPEQVTALTTAKQELTTAKKELTAAQNEYNEALKNGTEEEKKAAAQKLENAQDTKNTAEGNVQKQQQNVNKATATATGKVQTLAGVITELGSSSEMSLTQVGQLAGTITETFSEAGDKWGGIVGAIFSLLDSIGQEGLDGFLGNIVDSLANAAYGAWDTVFGWTGLDFGGESDEHLAEDIETLTESNQSLEAAIDRLADKMDDATLTESTSIYEQQVADLEQQMKNTQEMMSRSGAAYSSGFLGIGGTHSSNKRIDDAMTADEWARISEIVGRTIDSASDFWTLSSEEMWNVADQAYSIYAKIQEYADDGHENAAQYMDEYIEYYEQLEELLDAYREKLTSFSFDDIESEFKNQLLDMEADAEDFAESFEEMMQQAVINSMMSNTYSEKLQEWYANFAAALESGGEMTSAEQEALRQQYQSIVDDALEERDALMEAMGWDSSSSSSQSSTTGYSTSMSQETGEEISGRLTAVYESNLRLETVTNTMNSNVLVMTTAINAMARSYTVQYECTTEIRDILQDCNDHLDRIERGTNRLTAMQELLEDIEKNTKNL